MKALKAVESIDYLKLLFLSSIWAGSFICIEVALQEYSFLFIAFIRIFFAALFFLPIIYFKKLTFPKDAKTWRIIILAALLNNSLPFSLLAWGQQYINASTASIVLAVGPFIALILSHFITKDEKFTFFKLLGVIFGFLGIVLLLADGFNSDNINAFYGQIAVLFASMGYIASGLLLRKLHNISSIITSSSMFICASLILFPFVLYFDTFIYESYLNTAFYALIFLALIPTACASIIRIKIIQSVGVQFMSLVTYLIPLFTIFWAWVIFDESPKDITYISLFLVLLGLFIRKIKIKQKTF